MFRVALALLLVAIARGTSASECVDAVSCLSEAMPYGPTALDLAARLLKARDTRVWEQAPSLRDTDTTWCKNNSYFELLPAHVADVLPGKTVTCVDRSEQ